QEFLNAVEFREGEQLSIFGASQFAGVMLATDLMRHVAELSDVTAAQVRESRVEYRKASDALAPYRRVLDVYTSRWFGNEPLRQRAGSVDVVVEFLRTLDSRQWLDDPLRIGRVGPLHRKVGETALRAAADHRF